MLALQINWRTIQMYNNNKHLCYGNINYWYIHIYKQTHTSTEIGAQHHTNKYIRIYIYWTTTKVIIKTAVLCLWHRLCLVLPNARLHCYVVAFADVSRCRYLEYLFMPICSLSCFIVSSAHSTALCSPFVASLNWCDKCLENVHSHLALQRL